MLANLRRNIGRRFSDVVLYNQLASQKGISNRAKSAYNRAAIILASTIVEGLVFAVIQKKTGVPKPIIHSDVDRKNIHRIPAGVLGRSDIVIAKEYTKDICLSDRQCTFNLMNIFCRDQGYVTPKQFKRLQYVRDKRNELHVQTLSGNDRGHTGKTLNLIGDAIDFLIVLLR